MIFFLNVIYTPYKQKLVGLIDSVYPALKNELILSSKEWKEADKATLNEVFANMEKSFELQKGRGVSPVFRLRPPYHP